jgi:putative transcriptional regulator
MLYVSDVSLRLEDIVGKRTTKIDLYGELKEGLEEMVAIEKGERAPARVHRFFSKDDIKALRERAGVSQREFATMLGVSRRTLQEWEQGRRTPTGPAMNLLRVYEASPETVAAALT